MATRQSAAVRPRYTVIEPNTTNPCQRDAGGRHSRTEHVDAPATGETAEYRRGTPFREAAQDRARGPGRAHAAEKTIPGSHLNALKTRLKSRRRKAGHAIDPCGKVFGSSISGFLASVEHVRHSRGAAGQPLSALVDLADGLGVIPTAGLGDLGQVVLDF